MHQKSTSVYFASFFIEIPKMSRLCLLIITHWQDIYSKSCFFSQAIQHTAIAGGLHNHFLALWICKKQQSDKTCTQKSLECFLLPLLFLRAHFAKLYRELVSYMMINILLSHTDTHTHTQTLSYITAGRERNCPFYAKCIYFFSSSKWKKVHVL